MIKTINIGEGQSFEINSSNGWLYIYQEQFGHDVLPVLLPAAEALIQIAADLMKDADTEDVTEILKNADSETISDAFITLSGMQLTTLTNIVWAMAKNANYEIEAPREWMNSFDIFPWDIIIPQALKAALEASVSKKKIRYDAGKNRKAQDPIGIEKITVAAVDRGLTIDAVKHMELGQLVDYVIEWNNVHCEETDGDGETIKEKEQDTKRKATQADWDAFFG